MDSERRLLQDVSHELRSPLARLQAASGFAREQPSRADVVLERIERESVRKDRLVSEILTLSRMDDRPMRPLREEVDIDNLIAAIVEDSAFEADLLGRSVVTVLASLSVAIRNVNCEVRSLLAVALAKLDRPRNAHAECAPHSIPGRKW